MTSSSPPVSSPRIAPSAYIAMLTALGLSMDEARPDWRAEVKDRLRAFRRAVATALVAAE